MWMEENLGSRVNENRSAEALDLEPDVVAAVSKSVTALLRKAQSGADPAESGAAEAREVARLVLASRTIRSHVEPLLTRLLSELDDDETSGIVE